MPIVQNIVQNIVPNIILAIVSKVRKKRYAHMRYYNYEHRYGHTLLIIAALRYGQCYRQHKYMYVCL